MSTESVVRHERKFVIEHATAAEVEAWLRLRAARIEEEYPSRFVNSIYCDLPGLDLLADSVFGHGRRVKVRLRWYGDARPDRADANLEFKHRKNDVVEKATYRFHDLAFDWAKWDREGAPPLRRIVDLDRIDEAYRPLAAELRPTLMNRYRRHYLRLRGENCRLTLDEEIRFTDLRAPHFLGKTSLPSDDCVLELKTPPLEARDAAALFVDFPFRLAKSSKYVSGMETLLR